MKGSSITKERPDHLSNVSVHTLVPEKTMSLEEKQPVSQSDSLVPVPTSEAPLPPTMPDLISFPLMNNLQGDMVPLVGGSQLIEPTTPIIGDKPMEQYIIDDSIADFESNSKVPTLKDSLLPNSENI
ncbi:hypothetical protein K7432_018027 [Basidiobolus ranarum]|uniref:Uncharacterized protein n=1 Tax=Basidiobolus ranarum TaxID=34480 RepID=A0ABR2VJJ7_9FUNG